MSSITPEQNTSLQNALSGLVQRLLAQAGLTIGEVNQAITTYVNGIVAGDAEAQSGTGPGLVSTSQATMVANKAIEDWVSDAPGALDTLREIAAALQDNPDIISEILTQLGLKASIEYVDGLFGNIALKQNVNFNDASYDGLFAIGGKTVNDILPAKHLGTGTAGRLSFGLADHVPTVTDPLPDSRVVMVEADVLIGGARVVTTADNSDGGLGQSVFTIDHQGGPVMVIVGGTTVYDPAAPSPINAPDLSVPGQVTLANYAEAGRSVILIAYNSKATESTFNIATIRAYVDGRTFTAHLNGDGQATQLPLAWSCADTKVENLAKVLTDAFNAEAQV